MTPESVACKGRSKFQPKYQLLHNQKCNDTFINFFTSHDEIIIIVQTEEVDFENFKAKVKD